MPNDSNQSSKAEPIFSQAEPIFSHTTPDGNVWDIFPYKQFGRPTAFVVAKCSNTKQVHMQFPNDAHEAGIKLGLDVAFPKVEGAESIEIEESVPLMPEVAWPTELTPSQEMFCRIIKDSAEAWYLFRFPFKPGGTQVIDGVICQYRFRESEIEYDIRNDMLNNYGNAGVGEKLIVLKQSVSELDENLKLAEGRKADYQREFDILENSKKELDARNETKRLACEAEKTDYKPDIDVTFNERGGMKVSLDREAAAVESFTDQLDLATFELEKFTDANPIAEMPHRHLNFTVIVQNAPK